MELRNEETTQGGIIHLDPKEVEEKEEKLFMLKSSDEVGKELLMFYKILYVLYLSR
jgi:hypothetical protein